MYKTQNISLHQPVKLSLLVSGCCMFTCVSSAFQLLWNYKLNLTTDPKFESVANEVCKTTISEVSGLNQTSTV